MDRVLLVGELSLLPLRLRVLSWERGLILHRGQVCKIPILVGSVRECQTSNRLLLAADIRCSAILLGDIKKRLILVRIILVKPLVTLVVLLVDMQIIFLVPSVIEGECGGCVLVQLQLILDAHGPTLLMRVQSGIQAVLPLLRILILFVA